MTVLFKVEDFTRKIYEVTGSHGDAFVEFDAPPTQDDELWQL
jgi:hypothetical protein